MDKRKVIAAYRKGYITKQECAQILGLHSVQVFGLLDELTLVPSIRRRRQPVNSRSPAMHR